MGEILVTILNFFDARIVWKRQIHRTTRN